MKPDITKITNYAARILGYVAALSLCVFFALYMSASAGWTIFYVLASALLFSFIVTAVTFHIHCIEISSEVDNTMVYKGENLTLKIKVRNKSILPVPAIIVTLKECEGLAVKETQNSYVVSVSPRSTTELTVCYKAKMWGKSTVGVNKISMMDFLHFLNLPMYKETGLNSYSHQVKVFPNIPDIPSDTPLVKSAAENIRSSDETEDTKESDKLYLFGGMPGYTHRDYVEGDPLKRINWKLSSKKDEYMVRLDDEIESMQQVIVLDSVGSSRFYDERAVESVLAVAFSLFRLGFDATVWYNTPNGFTSLDISDYGDVTALQTAFADYSFTLDKNVVRIPIDELEKKKQAGGIMLFTSAPDHKLAAETETALHSSGTVVTAVISSDKIMMPTPYWIVGEDFSSEFIS